MRKVLPPLAAALLLAAGAARAAESGPLRLTLPQAMELAARQNRGVLKALEFGAGVEATYRQKYADALPQLTLEAYGSRTDDASYAGLGPPVRTDSAGLKVGVTQPLYTSGKLGTAIKLAEIGRSTAADRLADAQAAALRDAAGAFYGVLLARELEALAAQNLAQKKRHLDEARLRLAAGTATDYDVLAASVAEQNARPELIRAADAVRDARDRLASVLGVQDRDADAVGALEVAPEPVPDAVAALQAAVANRPELAELRKSRAIAEGLVRIAAAGGKPQIGFSADAGWAGINLDGAGGDGQAWSASVGLSWPLFDGGRTRAEVAKAESDARRLAIDEQEFLKNLELSARAAVEGVHEAAAILEALAGTVTQAERLLAMAERGYALGVKTRLEVDDAQTNLTQARAGVARGRRDLLLARINLRWVMGVLRP